MVDIHRAMATASERFASAGANDHGKFDIYERAMNRCARTFGAQIEALKHYRSRGEQKITTEHVTVNDGGQAIVGNVSTGGRGKQ